MSGLVIQMQGLASLTARLTALAATAQGKPIKAALRAAGNVVKKEIIAAAPYDDKTPDGVHIKKNVVVGRSRSKSRYGCEVFTVGIKYGKHVAADTAVNRKLGIVGKKVKNEGAAFYWKFIEFGTSRQDKKPFIRPAAQAAAKDALDEAEKKMAEAIAKIERGTP